MPSLEESGLHQKAVLWAYAGVDRYGKAKVYDPVEISVRWSLAKRRPHEATKENVTFDSTAVVKQDITVGGIMWLGALADLPDPVSDLKDVVGFEKTPSLKNRHFFRTVSLNKRSDALPDVVGTG